jgi:heptosyltransferase II
MKKIAIIQTAFLGDTALISAMIDSIFKIYKDAKLYIVTKKGYEDLFKNDRRVKKIITFDKRGNEKGLKGIKKISKTLTSLNLDILINTHRSFRSGLVSLFTRAKKKIIFKENPLSFLFKNKVKRSGIHEIYKNHLLLEKIDEKFKKVKPKKYTLFPPKTINNKKILDFVFKPFIVISPGSKWETKRWPKENFKELIKTILNFYPKYKIVLTGDKNDEKILNYLEKIGDKRIVSLKNINLEELMYVLKRTSLLVTNDSAPTHIASSFNVPVIAIFGPTVKEFGFYPFNTNGVVIENKNIKCRPCGIHGHNRCPIGTHDCMQSISSEKVRNEMKKFLN